MRAWLVLVMIGCAPPAKGTIELSDGSTLDLFDGFFEVSSEGALIKLYLTNRVVDCNWPVEPGGRHPPHLVEMFLTDVGVESEQAAVFVLNEAGTLWEGVDLVPFAADVTWPAGATRANGTVTFEGGTRGTVNFKLPVCGAASYTSY
jgi:hypothetical protein